MNLNYGVIRADLPTHKPDILRLWSNEAPHPTLFERRYAWSFEEIPSSGPRACWLLVNHERQETAGAFCLSQRRFRVDHESMDLYRAADLSVDARHRVIWPARQLVASACNEAKTKGQIVFACPNKLAASVLRLSGFVTCGDLIRYAKVLRVEPYLRRMLRHPLAAKAAAVPAQYALQALSYETWKGLPKGLVVAPVEEFDDRFDRLWERAASRFSIVGERTAAYLRWRYQRYPMGGYAATGLFSDDGAVLHAYAIVHGAGDHLTISDLFFERTDRLALLLADVIRRARRAGAASIAVNLFGGEAIIPLLRRFGFSARPDRRPVLFFPATDTERLAFLSNPSNWYFTSGDDEEEIAIEPARDQAAPLGGRPAVHTQTSAAACQVDR